MASRPGATVPGLPPGTFCVNYPSAERGIYVCPSETRSSGSAFPWNFALHYKMNIEAGPTCKGDGTPTIARDTTVTAAPYYGFFRVCQWVKWSYLKPGKILVAEAYAPGTADSMIYYPAKPDGRTPK